MSKSTLNHTTSELAFFGKLPCRGDFVRSSQHGLLTDTLDQWQSQTMDRLSADPRWKLVYDAAPAVSFAVLGTGSQLGLAGHWLASQDASGRRFPFITASAFEQDDPREFARVSPVALGLIWARLEQVARVAHAATEFEHAQSSLMAPLAVVFHPEAAANAFQDFLETHTVASLEQMLAASGSRVSLRQATLALGLLLQPAMAQGAARLHKVLCLPLVHDQAMKGVVAAWWLSLVLGFFARHQIELGLFLASLDGVPYLMLGFHGASPATLSAVIDPAAMRAQGVQLTDLDWIESEVAADYGLRKLSTYLLDPGLSLAHALSVYEEVFLGV
jgi:type VI secretion system protein ImpM